MHSICLQDVNNLAAVLSYTYRVHLPRPARALRKLTVRLVVSHTYIGTTLAILVAYVT